MRRRWRTHDGTLLRRLIAVGGTIFLILLVMMSLVWSALIWSGTPSEVSVDRPSFYSSASNGRLRSIVDVFKPHSLWVWTSGNELFRIGGGSKTATKLMSQLQAATALSLTGYPLGRNAPTMPPSGQYLALRFGDGRVPVTLLMSLFKETNWHDLGDVSSLFFLTSTSDPSRYTITFQIGKTVFRAALIHAPRTLQYFFSPNDQATPYAQIPFGKQQLFLPYSSAVMRVEEWTLSQVEPSHMIDSIFADPTMLQTVRLSKRQMLYTDGSRGVSVTRTAYGNEIDYVTNSTPLNHVHFTARAALGAAVSYVNNHGGFLGAQVFSHASALSSGRMEFSFSDMIDGWSLFGPLDHLTVGVASGSVVSMSRSLTYLGKEIEQRKQKILSGTQLIERLGENQTRSITSISLGYGERLLSDNHVQLVPVYQLQLHNHTVKYVYAATGAPFSLSGV